MTEILGQEPVSQNGETLDTAPEMSVSLDMVRRGIYVSPILIIFCGVIWGTQGLAGSSYGVALVFVNLIAAAAIIKYTAPISLGLLMGAVMFGYVFRLAFLFGAVVPLRNATWISLPALGLTMLVTHIGLLVWEIKYVSMSLAFPGLKPKNNSSKRGKNL